MATLPPSSHSVKVVALLTGQRELVLIDQPLTLDTLALLQPVSPLSRMFLDGAGMEYRPKGIVVYVDGKRVWTKDCPHHGATDASPSTQTTHATLHAIPFADAFCDDCDYDENGRLARNRAAMEHLHNDYSGRDDADEWAADVIEAAGSQRPKLRPAPVEPESAKPHAPCPCPTYGKSDTPLGLPYKPLRQVRHTDKGTEMLLGHDFATL